MPSMIGILNSCGRVAGDNGVTTLVTTGIGGVRAGTVLFDKHLTKKEKADTVTWTLGVTGAGFLAQLGIYKYLKPLLSNIAIHNLKLENHAKELKQLEEHLPEAKIQEAMINLTKKIGPKPTNEFVLKQIKQVITEHVQNDAPNKIKIAGEKLGKGQVAKDKLAEKLCKNFELMLTKEAGGESKNITSKVINKSLKKLKRFKGGYQRLNFIFGVAIGTSYLVPWLVTKNIGKISAAMSKEGKAKAKEIKAKKSPEQLKKEKSKELKSWIFEFITPIVATAGSLAILKNPKKIIGKLFGDKVGIKFAKKLNKSFKKATLKEYAMNETNKIARNIKANIGLRAGTAFMAGNPFLGVYQVVMEGISLCLVKGLEKVVGNAEAGKGIAGLANKVLEKKGVAVTKNMRKGIDMLTTHVISTYLTLGLLLGIATNYIAKPLSDGLKKIIPEHEVDKKAELEARKKSMVNIANKKLNQTPELKTLKSNNPMLQKYVAKQMSKA